MNSTCYELEIADITNRDEWSILILCSANFTNVFFLVFILKSNNHEYFPNIFFIYLFLYVYWLGHLTPVCLKEFISQIKIEFQNVAVMSLLKFDRHAYVPYLQMFRQNIILYLHKTNCECRNRLFRP